MFSMMVKHAPNRNFVFIWVKLDQTRIFKTQIRPNLDWLNGYFCGFGALTLKLIILYATILRKIMKDNTDAAFGQILINDEK